MSEYFARINTKEEVQQTLDLLAAFNPRIETKEYGYEVFAPDGDLVFAAVQVRPGVFACRFHKEVFDPENGET